MMMRMRLDPRWRDILRRAWSVRLMLLAAWCSAIEAVLTLFPDVLPLSRPALAVLTPLAIAAAFVARLVAQKGL
jgi:hypothetical protein